MKNAKYQYIVEKLIELSCAGVVIEFSEHMGETVVQWPDPDDKNIMHHDHVFMFNGTGGAITSLTQIIGRIEQMYLGKL